MKDTKKAFGWSDNSDLLEQIVDKYLQALEVFDSNIKWYEKKLKIKRFWSTSNRGISIILIGLGGLIPLISTIINTKQWEINNFAFSNLGYVLFGLAAVLLSFDKFFGLSTGWMRYMKTKMELEKEKELFELKWFTESVKQHSHTFTTERALVLIKIITDFLSIIKESVKKETDAWITEFEKNIEDLNKLSKTQVDASQPGSIKVTIKNTEKYSSLILKMDAVKQKDIFAGSLLLTNIKPGSKQLQIAEIKELNEKVIKNEVVIVKPNETTSIEIEL